MSVSIQVPDDLYEQALKIANTQHLPVDEVFVAAFAHQLAELDRLRRRASGGSREELVEILDKAPAVEPEEYDRL
jgi:hypothetical protein